MVDFGNFKLGWSIQNLHIPKRILSQMLLSAISESGKLNTRLQMKKNKTVLCNYLLEGLDIIYAFK